MKKSNKKEIKKNYSKKTVKKKFSKRILKSDIEILRNDKSEFDDEKSDERIMDFSEDAEIAGFMLPSTKTPVLERVSVPQRQTGFKLEKWAKETSSNSDEEETNSAKYSLPKISGITYVEPQSGRIETSQIDMSKLGREERNFGQQTAFSQSSEAKITNSPVFERYEDVKSFNPNERDASKEFSEKKIRYDAKFSGR